jgi:peptidyl-prolyl cis-trans isomerase B (cyclophilin B)
MLMPARLAHILTEKGDIVLELFPDEAPGTVANFAKLAEAGFYDGLTFHRVIPHFVIQGGCPKGDGTGGPGYTIRCETDGNPHRHQRGSLSMAHAGRDTGGSQFFICHEPQPHLDGVHTVFGQVREGMDVVDAIRPGDRMVRVTVSEDRLPS